MKIIFNNNDSGMQQELTIISEPCYIEHERSEGEYSCFYVAYIDIEDKDQPEDCIDLVLGAWFACEGFDYYVENCELTTDSKMIVICNRV